MKKNAYLDFKAVKQAISMLQVLDHYGITDRFKHNGDSLSGPFPIHKGTDTTQFRVSISKNCWNCFGQCKHGGNERGLTPENVTEFGLDDCANGSMSGRIVIPIHDNKGELVAYAGRSPGDPTNERPQYKLPAGLKKSTELFNVHRAIRGPADQPLVVVEGFFDVIKFWQHSCKKVVALMGSILSPAQVKSIMQQTNVRSTVLLMFDEDDAGRFGRERQRLYVRVFNFTEEGQQPEHLMPEQVQELVGGVL